jgi:hypothetical protein
MTSSHRWLTYARYSGLLVGALASLAQAEVSDLTSEGAGNITDSAAVPPLVKRNAEGFAGDFSTARFSGFGNNVLAPLSIKDTMSGQCFYDNFKSESAGSCGFLLSRRTLVRQYYKEPAALVEVSCLPNYSLLTSGTLVPEAAAGPAGAPPSGGPSSLSAGGGCRVSNGTWFFDARVIGLGGKSQARANSNLGVINSIAARQCRQDGEGYGKKFSQFQKPAGKDLYGPLEGAWVAYESKNDVRWRQPVASPPRLPPTPDQREQCAATPTTPECLALMAPIPNPLRPTPCTATTTTAARSGEKTSVEACWGRADVATGWVNHSSQPVAAALVALRAYNKAMQQRTVSPDGQPGLDLEMSYPFVFRSSAFGQSMGLPGVPVSVTTEYRGSSCFKAGDPGPWWYTFGRAGRNDPQFARSQQSMQLTIGNAAQVAELHPGYFVFTIWVDTACRRPTASSGCGWQDIY